MITENQYESLVQAIYESLISNPDFGLGDMGECHDEAVRIVNDWVQKNSLILN